MAREPQIEFEGYAFKVKRFNNDGAVVSCSVTPTYFDKSQNQWVDKETMYFDVSGNDQSKTIQNTVNEIERLLQAGESVHVLVSGGLTERKGSQGGTFKNVYASRFYVIGHKPKQQQQGAAPASAANPYTTGPANPYGSTAAYNTPPAADPWSAATSGEPDF